MNLELKGKKAMVTGAASGIGRVVAEALLAEGATVFGCGLEPEAAIDHGQFHYAAGDLTNFSTATGLADACHKAMGGLDILIHCAGITGTGTIETTSPEEFRRQFEVNVFATFNICKAVLPLLKKSAAPCVVNIGSELGMRTGAERVAYGPAKAAVHMLTQCMAVDCAPALRVNAVLPGLTETPMTQARFEADPSYRSFVQDRYPLKRICTPEDVCAAVLFLASARARNITGELMAVAGGGHIFICN